jgi:type VI secretion system protein ImpJ
MDKNFKLMNPVQWHEGLLLYPQHFQQMRREFQELGLCYLTMGTPYYWGVRSVAVDDGALSTGLLRLKSLLAVMPDGSVLRHDVGGSQTIELQLKDHQEALDQGPLMVHLAVVRHNPDAPAVGGDFPRYDSIESAPLPDENTGESAVPVPRLSLKPLLVAGDQVPVRYASLPLFKIRSQDGGYVFEGFIPPALDIRASSKVGQLADRVVKSIRKYSALLSDRLQTPMTQDLAPVLEQYKKNYDTLVSRLLALEALVQSEVAHPFELYKELTGIAGAFCSFSRGHMPPIFPHYDHNDLKKTFGPVLTFIDQMLEFVKSTSSAFAFRLDDRIFKNILKPEWIQEDQMIMGVTLPAGATTQTMTDWIKDAVIVSSSMAQKAIERRVLGAGRAIVEQVPELGLTMTRGKLLLRVQAQSEYIKHGEDLFVFNLSDTSGARPAEVVIYTASE